MDKYEHRRLKLLQLRDDQCEGKASVLAEKIDRAPSYVSRMLYQEGKIGKKRIADDMMEIIEKAFDLPRGWLDGIGTVGIDTDKELSPHLEKKSPNWRGDTVNAKKLSHLITLWFSLPPEAQDDVIRFAEANSEVYMNKITQEKRA